MVQEAREKITLNAVHLKGRNREKKSDTSGETTGTKDWGGGWKKACSTNDRYHRIFRLRCYCTVFDSPQKKVGSSR